VSKSFLRACTRTAVVTVGVTALSLAGALAASAHVTVSVDTTAAGSYALLTFGVPHGCDGSATTEIAIKVPDQVRTVTPTVNPNWDVRTVTEALNPPVTDSDGDQITERVDQVVYTAKTPLPADLRDALVLSMQIPDVSGQTLQFPVVQSCEVGETAWIEQQQAGGPEPAHPAPSIVVTAATASAASAASAVPTSTAAVASTATTESGSGNPLAIAGLVAGLLGLVVGGIALARSRRT